MSNSLHGRKLTGGGSVLSLLLALLLVLALAACSNAAPTEVLGSLTVSVSDSSSKAIAYEPAVGYPSSMSHYIVTVKDSEGGVLQTSGYMPLSDGTGRFQVTNLVSGTYTIDVSGYLQTGESSYSLIATGTETAAVSAALENTVVIEIDTFDDAYTGDITVDVTMPVDVVVNNTVTGTLSWTLAAIGNDALSFTGSKTLSGTALEDGVYTLVIDDGNIPAGRYLLTVTLDNGSPYSSVEAVVAYPGLPSTGTLSLDSRKPADYSFTVTDMIGGELAVNGEGEFVAETGSFVVTLEKGLTETEKAIWYVDGEEVDVQKGEGNAYTITGLDGGRHVVVLVVYDTALESAVGSLTMAVEVQGELTIEVPSHFLYTDNGDGTCTITGFNPDNMPTPFEDFPAIPDEINGLTVTAIGKEAFCDNDRFGFSGDVIIPDSVITIEDGAFCRAGLVGKIVLGKNVETIGNQAFCENDFTGSLVIPDSVTTIGDEAFSDIFFDGTLTLGENVKTIGISAFQGCAFTGNLVIPDSVTTIGSCAFDSLTVNGTLTIGSGIKFIEVCTFSYSGFIGSLIIPDGVQIIGASAFVGTMFSSVSLPGSLSEIKEAAFANCSMEDLSLTITEGSMLEIGDGAFDSCSQLECTIIIPEGATLTVGDSVFQGCYNVSVKIQGGTLNGDLGSDVDVSYDFS